MKKDKMVSFRVNSELLLLEKKKKMTPQLLWENHIAKNYDVKVKIVKKKKK